MRVSSISAASMATASTSPTPRPLSMMVSSTTTKWKVSARTNSQMVESTPGSGWEARCTERAAWIGPMVQDTLATSRRIFVMVQAISHGLTAECFRADGSMESKSLSHRMARIMRQMKATGPRTDACLRAEVAIYFSTKTIHRSCLVVTFVLPAECTDVVPRKSKPQIQIVLPADTAFHQACTKAIFSSRWSDVVMDRLPSSAASHR
mmetsp:Transcript_38095/g.89232  ORF Transcript_38095/g.89232 Transcript_38095/m.89232 type:complete len:207 (+) Transcript_38095:756-1376(+)